MQNFEQFKTPIFPGINDRPEEATIESASNGSDLINKVNRICDELDRSFPSEPQLTTYQITFDPNNEIDPNTLEDNQFTSLNSFGEFLKKSELTEDILINIKGQSSDTDTLDLDGITVNSPHKIFIKGIECSIFVNQGNSTNPSLFIVNTSNIELIVENVSMIARQTIFITNIAKITFISCDFVAVENHSFDILYILRIENLKLSKCTLSSISINKAVKLAYIAESESVVLNACTFICQSDKYLNFFNCNVYFENKNLFPDLDLASSINLIGSERTSVFLDRNSFLDAKHFTKGTLGKTSKELIKNRDAGCFSFYFSNIQANTTIPLIIMPPFDFVVHRALVDSNISPVNFVFKKNNNPLSISSNFGDLKKFNGDNLDNAFEQGTLDRLNIEILEDTANLTVQVIYYRY